MQLDIGVPPHHVAVLNIDNSVHCQMTKTKGLTLGPTKGSKLARSPVKNSLENLPSTVHPLALQTYV
jgi:hypothetical protein